MKPRTIPLGSEEFKQALASAPAKMVRSLKTDMAVHQAWIEYAKIIQDCPIDLESPEHMMFVRETMVTLEKRLCAIYKEALVDVPREHLMNDLAKEFGYMASGRFLNIMGKCVSQGLSFTNLLEQSYPELVDALATAEATLAAQTTAVTA